MAAGNTVRVLKCEGCAQSETRENTSPPTCPSSSCSSSSCCRFCRNSNIGTTIGNIPKIVAAAVVVAAAAGAGAGAVAGLRVQGRISSNSSSSSSRRRSSSST